MNEFIITARKRSDDPVQEALRQHKDTWNHEASLLIAQLIAFKRGLNGRGEPKVGLPPGSIKDPVPNEIGSYLDQLADRYNRLISDAHKIIEEQNHYSENRKKGLKEQTANFDPEIMKIASWWGSRALTYTKNQYLNPKYWLSKNESTKIRMIVLKISTDLIKKLKIIDGDIVSNDINATPNAVYDFDKFVSSFNKLLISNLKKIIEIEKINETQHAENSSKNNFKETVNESGREDESVLSGEFDSAEKFPNIREESESKNSEKIDIKQILSDIVYCGRLVEIMNLLKIDQKDVIFFESSVKALRKLLDSISISNEGSFDNAINSYNDLKLLSAKLLKVNNDSFLKQLSQANDILLAKTSAISLDFEKLAKKSFKRFLDRQKLKILPDSMDRIKLDCSKKITNLINLIDDFQNLLEKNEQNLDVLISKVNNIIDAISETADDLYYLAKTHNDNYEQNRLNGKPSTNLIKTEMIHRLKNFKNEVELLKTKLK